MENTTFYRYSERINKLIKDLNQSKTLCEFYKHEKKARNIFRLKYVKCNIDSICFVDVPTKPNTTYQIWVNGNTIYQSDDYDSALILFNKLELARRAPSNLKFYNDLNLNGIQTN